MHASVVVNGYQEADSVHSYSRTRIETNTDGSVVFDFEEHRNNNDISWHSIYQEHI